MNLDHRGLIKILGLVYVLSFGLNLIWEMVQMPLFRGVDWSPASWGMCTAASLGDAVFSAATYAVLALRHRNTMWVCARDGRDVLLVIAAGVLTSTMGESMERSLGWWSYSPLMPLMPGLEIGAAPLVQLAILTLLSFEILRAFKLSAQRA